MVYAAVFVFSVITAGAAVLVLLVGWKSEEDRIQSIMTAGASLVGDGPTTSVPTIEQLQKHVDAELVEVDGFAASPSARSLYAAGGGAMHAA